MRHNATHDLDRNVATVTATGRQVDFCYQCDDFVLASRPIVIRPYQHRVMHYNGRVAVIGNYLGNGTIRVTTVQGTYGPCGSLIQHTYRER